VILDVCYDQIVTARRGGAFAAGGAMRFGSLQTAVAECESLQRDFDADAEPRRVYVLDAGRDVFATGTRAMIKLTAERRALLIWAAIAL
jgi:hypothetical protein